MNQNFSSVGEDLIAIVKTFSVSFVVTEWGLLSGATRTADGIKVR